MNAVIGQSFQDFKAIAGMNDVKLYGGESTAGLGIAYHAKPKVKENASQSISTIGLDGVLYFIGFKDSFISEAN